MDAGVTPERILQLAWGYAPPLAIEAAIRHGVFDALERRPMTVAETAEATGTSERALGAVMHLLAGLGLLAKTEGDRFGLTPESATFLVSSKPSYLGGFVKHCSDHLIPRWLGLNEVVVTGRPVSAVNQEAAGAAFFQEFVADLFPVSYGAARKLADYVTKNSNGAGMRVLDLAAGSGVWSIALAQSSPGVTVTAVDWPGVLPVTKRTVERFGLGGRYTFVAGDLRDADFGTGHDVATLGHILHSDGEERSRALLKKTFDALAPGGTIAIAEYLVNADRSGPVGGLIFAVNMVVNTDDGNTFSFEEIREWLTEAGFENPRLLEAPSPSPLILATKPSK